MPSSEGLPGTRLACCAPSARESVLMPARVAHASRKPSLVIAGPGFPGSASLRFLRKVLGCVDRGSELADQLLRNATLDERRKLVRPDERPFPVQPSKVLFGPPPGFLMPARRRTEEVPARLLMVAEMGQKAS